MSSEEGPIVMVVDDERDFLQLTRAVLERHGYHVDTRTRAPSWRELLRIGPAVILMDVLLEGENGSEVCRAIKSHKRLAHLPVVFISGQSEDHLRKEVAWCKADGFLTKPIGRSLLLQLAEHYVQRHRRRSIDAAPAAAPPEGSTPAPPDTSPRIRPVQEDPGAGPLHEKELRPMEHAAAMRARSGEGPGSKEE